MVSVVSGKVCFNSTLVQLKGDRTLKNGPMSTCFNSTLVQLKGKNFSQKHQSKSSFNSTLVQLKVYCRQYG